MTERFNMRFASKRDFICMAQLWKYKPQVELYKMTFKQLYDLYDNHKDTKMDRTKLIQKILKENLNLCQNNTEFNDSMLFDLLMYGFKGFENMTIEELNTELENLS